MTYIEIREAIRRIKTALRERTGRDWSVRIERRRATWIRITAPKGRLVCCHLSAARQPFRGCESGSCRNGWKPEFMQHDDRAMLSMALGHHEQIHSVGIVVYPMQRAEYVNRAEGRA